MHLFYSLAISFVFCYVTGYSLDAWLTNHGLPDSNMLTTLDTVAQIELNHDLGIAHYLLDSSCQLTDPTQTVNGWTSGMW